MTLGRYDVTAVMANYAAMLALLAAVGVMVRLRWPYYAGLGVAGGLMLYHYFLIRDRSREAGSPADLRSRLAVGPED